MRARAPTHPPLWFAEGMAAYLSRGPYDSETAMILRDAALEGRLPTIDQMTNDPRIFPYRFGQALISYIGERWGDEAIGAIRTRYGPEDLSTRLLGTWAEPDGAVVLHLNSVETAGVVTHALWRRHEVYVSEGTPDPSNRVGMYHRAINVKAPHLNSATPGSLAQQRGRMRQS